MWRSRSRIGIGLASTLVALTAWAYVCYGDQAGAGEGAWIGVTVKPLSETWRSQWDYQGSGVLVTSVTPDGPAEHAGIMPGDLLVAVGSVSLRNESDLARAKNRSEPGESVSAVVARNNGRLIKIMNLEPVRDGDSETGSTPAGAGDAQVAQPPSSAEPSSPVAVPVPDASSGAKPTEPALEVSSAAKVTEPTPKAEAHDHWTAFGTQCADLNADLASALSVPASRGVLVLQVASGGFADRFGIRAGDVILGAGDQKIEGVASLQHALDGASTGLSLHVQRGEVGRSVDVSLEIPPAPADAQDSAQAQLREQQAMRNELQALQREIERLRAELRLRQGD